MSANGVKRFVRKPEPPRERGLLAAQYLAGQPLDALREVAGLSDSPVRKTKAAMVEVELDDSKLLLVRWLRRFDDAASEVEYVIVKDGDWLTWSDTYDSLDDDDTASLEHWYQERP